MLAAVAIHGMCHCWRPPERDGEGPIEAAGEAIVSKQMRNHDTRRQRASVGDITAQGDRRCLVMVSP